MPARASRRLTRLINRLRVVRATRYAFTPRPDDVFIVTYPRSGTTLMQMMLYQLTGSGGMEFFHISQFVPWFETSLLDGRDLASLPSPRCFKSHLNHKRMPRYPGRFIYVVRDGMDVAVSYYHLRRTHHGYKGSFEEFLDEFLAGDVAYGSWFDHVAGWARRASDDRVLWLRYEELCSDLGTHIRRVADFCDWELAEDRISEIAHRCSFEYMKAHEDKFDLQHEELWERGVESYSFIRSGQVGESGSVFTAEQKAAFERQARKKLAKLDLASSGDGLHAPLLALPR